MTGPAVDVEQEARKWLQIELDEGDNHHVDQAIRWALDLIRRQDAALTAVRELHAAHLCSCQGRRWTEDQNWSPNRHLRGQERTEGDGLMPCGFCNHGGWNVAQWDESGAVSCEECDQDWPCPTAALTVTDTATAEASA